MNYMWGEEVARAIPVAIEARRVLEFAARSIKVANSLINHPDRWNEWARWRRENAPA